MSAICPTPEMIKPLRCAIEDDQRVIYFKGNDFTDLKQIFSKMSLHLDKSDKSFFKFWLENTAINTLENDTFGDITFEFIYIYNPFSLKQIQPKAFSPYNTQTIKKSRTTFSI